MRKQTVSPELFRRLHTAILLTQRKMRRIRLLLPSALSTVESIILSHLAYDPNRTATDLVVLLRISKTKISRLLAELAANGCLRTEAGEDDKRARRLVFTARGVQMLSEADQLNSRISQIGCALLSPREHLQMVELFRKLNNGLGAPAERLRQGESPFAPEQRRAVIAMGMLGDAYMGTGYTLAQYQLLLEFSRCSRCARFAELTGALPVSVTKLSRMLTQFEKAGVIEKAVRSEDKRSREYRLTEAGEKEFNRLEAQIAERLARASEHMKTAEIADLAKLLELIDKAPLPRPEESGFRLTVCSSEQQFSRARAFLVKQLVGSDSHHNLDQYLLPDGGFCCIGTWNEEILMLLEIRPEKMNAKMGEMAGTELKYFAVASKLQNTAHTAKAFGDSLQLAFQEGAFDQILVRRTVVPETLIETLPFAVSSNENTWRIRKPR